ncbi:unnamed protein product, partial [Trichogramma brassicae]
MKNRISRAARASVRRTRHGCYRAATTAAVAAAAQVHEYKPPHHESCAVFAKALRTIILIGFCWRSYCAREMPLFAKPSTTRRRRRRRRRGVPLSLLQCTTARSLCSSPYYFSSSKRYQTAVVVVLRAQQLYACAASVLYTNTCTFCAVRCSTRASSRLSNSYCSQAIMHSVCVSLCRGYTTENTDCAFESLRGIPKSSACRASSSRAPPSARAARGTHIPD